MAFWKPPGRPLPGRKSRRPQSRCQNPKAPVPRNPPLSRRPLKRLRQLRRPPRQFRQWWRSRRPAPRRLRLRRQKRPRKTRLFEQSHPSRLSCPMRPRGGAVYSPRRDVLAPSALPASGRQKELGSADETSGMCLACCQRPAGRGMVVRRIGEWLLRSCAIASLSAGRMPAAR